VSIRHGSAQESFSDGALDAFRAEFPPNNVAFAKEYLSQGQYADAANALDDAERHYRNARDAVTIEQSAPVVNNLAKPKL
jgi:hypothetical protein